MNNLFLSYGSLALAIICEAFATSFLKQSAQFTKPLPGVCAVLGYAFCFYFLSIALDRLPMSIAYAIWCGAGVLLITVASIIIFRQPLDLAGYCGIALILAGVLTLNLFSQTFVR
jgi:small multidrug resistance pump